MCERGSPLGQMNRDRARKQRTLTLATKPQEKFKLVQDNDYHWYLIKAVEEEAFQQWVVDMETYNHVRKGREFSNDRIDDPSNVTFEFPVITEYTEPTEEEYAAVINQEDLKATPRK